ncbi:response regulator transcription factor [Bradyrhizobium canariense]|uniref:response regulator transcription factor n=1 Tax=Bradyrhizobium canariense TaxID=255045 RepID=UPI001302712D|nr:response regulator [Bradyrhizobium canariense]
MTQAPRIACIDDDPNVLEAILDVLHASGFVAEGFSSAEDFLTSGLPGRTSCLITDVKLGGMSGLQLQHSLAESGLGIPTIVISAFADDILTEAYGAGAVCVLSKPVLMDCLLICIRNALNRAGGEEKI